MPMLVMPDIFSSACIGSLSQYDRHNKGNSCHDENTISRLLHTPMLVSNNSRTDAAHFALPKLCIDNSEFCK